MAMSNSLKEQFKAAEVASHVDFTTIFYRKLEYSSANVNVFHIKVPLLHSSSGLSH